jgi:hypothetical protein
MDDDQKIVDGQIVSDPNSDSEDIEISEAETIPGNIDQSTVFLSLEELIKNHIDSIAKLKVELKKEREMYDDSFNNDPVYREHDEKVKEATKAKLSVKKQIGSQPSVALLAQKVKDLRFDISEQNKTLSDLLSDYKEQTGATQIETRDGQILELVNSIRLVKINSK